MNMAKKKKPKIDIITVKVSQHHIEQGDPLKCETCPIALAMIEAGLEQPVVKSKYVFFTYKGHRQTCSLPAPARLFITEFDGAKVCNRPTRARPINFTLEAEA